MESLTLWNVSFNRCVNDVTGNIILDLPIKGGIGRTDHPQSEKLKIIVLVLSSLVISRSLEVNESTLISI